MIPEIGHFALILALCLAISQAFLPIIGATRGYGPWMRLARPLTYGQTFFLILSFACLTWSFIYNDFSVKYVASHSNTALPLIYRISAVWGAHEGSLLLWAMLLGIWAAAVAVFSKNLPVATVARVLGVMGLISIGFLLFMLATSNPFDRLIPAAVEGRDLNPLLQDPGLAIHPPMLYMGYVGFSVAFSFAAAALIGGHFDATWARWSRPWTTIAWVFLTIGIALGSWWAYYELGWGGWWFWDPVENASFMPWLVGTALIHSLAVTEKRGAFKSWTLLLALLAFSLCLLGTFLVRSGVLTSVHAFATDPERGVFILAFLAIVVGGSLTLYAWRGPQIKSTGRFQMTSRETVLLLNNVLFVVAAASVLIGTLYPLVMDALGAGKISVGPPYFNTVFVPLMLPVVALLAFGPWLRWKKDQLNRIGKTILILLAISIVLGAAFNYVVADTVSPGVWLSLTLAAWVVMSSAVHLWQRIKSKNNIATGIKTTPLGFYGMTLAHVGVSVFVVGVTLTSAYSIEKDLRFAPGDSEVIGGYRFQFERVHGIRGPNYQGQAGLVNVYQGEKKVALLRTEKRIYNVQRNPMTEAAIDPGLFRDLYVALGEPLDQGAWSMRVYYKPFIRWIWLGAIFMALGGILAMSDRRYRLRASKKAPVSTGDEQSTARA